MNALTVVQPVAVAERGDVRALVAEWHASLALYVAAGDLSAATRTTYMIGVERFLAWCGARVTIDADVIRAWIAEQRAAGVKVNTINTHLGGVRAFFAWAVGAHRLPYNPTLGLKSASRKGKQHSRDALTVHEVRRVLAAPARDATPSDAGRTAGKRDKAILALMLYTALRSVEVHRADLKDLRTKSGHLVLYVQGKGHAESDEFVILAQPAAESALHDWLSARGQKAGPLFTSLSDRSRAARLSLRAIRQIVKHYFKLAGVRGERKTTHSLRHTAATMALLRGAPVQKVQTLLRHANIETTMIYAHEVDRMENPAEAFITYDELGA